MPGIEPPSPTAQPLLRVIVEAIGRGQIREGEPKTFLPYSKALDLMGVEWRGRAGQALQRHGLNELNVWTMNFDQLPKIAALIVNKKTHRPSAGFAKSHGYRVDSAEWETWWRKEADRAINFDWSPYLAPITRYPRKQPDAGALRVREDEEVEAPAYRDIIVVDPPPAHIRQSRITVGDVLRWLAAGQSETEILRRHRELRSGDIRASLAYAADKEQPAGETARKISRLSSFTEKWMGKFTLPQSDPDDPRRDYLLKRYWRHRK